MSTGPHRRIAVARWAVLLAVAVAPLAAVGVPGLVDYPNHLARAFILANFHHLPALQHLYRLHWGIQPNLAMDLVVPPLARWLPVEVAGRLFLAATVLVLAGGTAALARTLHGRVGVLPMLAVPLTYNIILAAGFVNFLFGCGLALMALAGWIASGDWPVGRRGALFGVVAVGLFFAHLFAAAVFFLLAAVGEAGRWRRGERMGAAAAALLLAALPVGVLWLLKPGGPPAATLEFGGLGDHLAALLGPMLFDGGRVDAVTVVAVLLLAVAGLVAARGRPFHPAMEWPLAALALLAVAMPATLMGGHCVNLRFPVLLALVAAAAARPALLSERLAWPLVVAVLALTVARSLDAAAFWRPIDGDFAEFRAAARVIPAGARVLPFHDDPTQHRPYQHMVDLAILDRCIFVPHLAKIADQQPLLPAPDEAAVDGGTNGDPVDGAQFAAGADPAASAVLLARPPPDWNYPYFANWPKRFDYVVHVDWGRHQPLRPDLLERVATGSFFEIFRVRGRPALPGGGCGARR